MSSMLAVKLSLSERVSKDPSRGEVLPARQVGSETVSDRCTRALSEASEADVLDELVELDMRSGSMGVVDSELALPAASRSRSVILAGAEGV
jgi:hypothetical protein